MVNSKTISLDQFRHKKEKEQAEKQFRTVLVWLHCPICKTTEYTEIVAPHGRTHFCGTPVEEIEVELDKRAELTITRYNIQKIDQLIKKNNNFKLRKLFAKSLNKALITLKKSEETYLKRLGENTPPYPGEIEALKDKLPIKEVNKLGLWISEFRYKPEERFLKKTEE